MRKPQTQKWLYISTAIFVAGGLSIAASAQTTGGSPFATKKKINAWETADPAPAPVQQQPTTAIPLRGSNLAFEAPAEPAPVYQNVPGYTVTPGSSSSEYQAPPNIPTTSSYTPSFTVPAPPSNYAAPAANSSGQFKPVYKSSQYPAQNYQAPTHSQAPTNGAYYPGRSGNAAGYQSAPQQGGVQPNGFPAGPQAQQTPYHRAQAPRETWKDRMGFGDIVTSIKGFLKIGAAATDRDDWSEDFIADGKVSGEISAITEGGLEYGLGAEVRGQYDKYRRGFGGLAGDCPATEPGCSSVDIGGTPTAFRGHTSRFYASGPSDAKDAEFALEGAYLFLRSSYGDVTLGRDDGAAYLFSLGAPTLLAVNASNSHVDYTGLDAVKTVNDASGFAEKITYVSPRLLGDNIGFGVQVGASYAPNARACGVDYCVRSNGKDDTGVIAPDLNDVLEVGLAVDRTFDNGLKVEATANYATASEDSTIAAFDDLQAYNLGFEVTYADWRMGGSYLDSNNGLANGDYKAWDAGVTWKPAAWGVSASYGQAVDDNIRLKSSQAVLGATYDFDKFTLGVGVQYIERKAPVANAGVITIDKETATALFIEGAVTF